MPALQDITSSIKCLGAFVVRCSASLGFNSSPTTFDLELVQGDNLVADTLATGFEYTGAMPGNISGLQFGSFKQLGVIQSWTENWSKSGKTFTVKMVDPRVIFNDVQIIMDGRGISNNVLPNILNAYAYYGSPKLADSTENGMAFSKIRDFLSYATPSGNPTGAINVYNKQFNIVWSSGWVTGVPDWYRIQGDETTLDAMLQQVSDDFGMDYYVYIDVDSYNPSTGIISKINIQHIKRGGDNGSTALLDFINKSTTSGILISYQRGQELRSDPTHVALYGSKYQYWPTVNTAQVKPCWGYDNDGNVIWGDYQPKYLGFADALAADHDETWGYVLLDHIVGTGVEILQDYTVEYENIIVQYSGGASIYPHSITRTFTTNEVAGYRPKPPVMRAALYSKESWEEMLYKHHYIFASGILGIYDSQFLSFADFLAGSGNNPYFLHGFSKMSMSRVNRTPIQQALIDAVYDATKETAEEYYGKRFIVNLPTSNLLAEGTYDASETFPRIEYNVAQAAWSQYTFYPPSGVGAHFVLHDTHHASFKDELGRIKPFCSFDGQDQYITAISGRLDMTLIPRSECLIDPVTFQLIIPMNVDQYEKDPDRAIVSLPYTLQAAPDSAPSFTIGGYNNTALAYPWYLFLKEMGYPDATIWYLGLLNNAKDNEEFGLYPMRFSSLPTTPGTRGVHIPLESNFDFYGPFTQSCNRPGGAKLIIDDSLAPWTYGNYANMASGGQVLISRANASGTIIDSAEIVNAGLPEYNLGDSLGNNSNITSMSLAFGSDGLTTSYSLRTFAIPPNRVSKILQDKISKLYTESKREKEKKFLNTDNSRIITKPEDLHNPDDRISIKNNAFGSVTKGFSNYFHWNKDR